MTLKLFRYDFINRWKELIYFALICLASAALARLFISLPDTWIYEFIGGFFSGLWIGMIIGCLVTFIFGSFGKFASSFYKDESYLNHTLPVSRSALYTSRVLVTLATLLILNVVFLVSFFIRFGGDPFYDEIILLIESYLSLTGVSLSAVIFVLVTVVDLEILEIILVGYLATVIGFRFQKHRVLWSVIIGFVIYLLIGLVLIGFFRLWAVFDPSMLSIFQANTVILPGMPEMNIPVQADLMIKAGWVAIGYFIIVVAVLWSVGQILFERGVNVD